MNLLYIGNFLSEKSGSYGVSEGVARRLIAMGHRVIITSHKKNRCLRLFDMINTCLRFRDIYNIAHVDIYSGSAFFWAEMTCIVLKLLKKPYILTLHGGNLPNFSRHWPIRVRWLLTSAAVVTTPSRYLQDKMHHYRADIIVIPNSIELKAYRYRLRSKTAPKLIWLRAFHRIYNPSLAPRVLADMKKQEIEGTLTMVGSDKGNGSLEEMLRLVDELKVRFQISIINGILKDQVPDQLNKGDIFINTTNIDNTPVSVIEAMACGLCIVSTNVGGIPYLLENEKDALLVPTNDSETMAKAIGRILTEPKLAARLSLNARAKAEQFDWALILPQWEQLFKMVIKNA